MNGYKSKHTIILYSIRTHRATTLCVEEERGHQKDSWNWGLPGQRVGAQYMIYNTYTAWTEKNCRQPKQTSTIREWPNENTDGHVYAQPQKETLVGRGKKKTSVPPTMSLARTYSTPLLSSPVLSSAYLATYICLITISGKNRSHYAKTLFSRIRYFVAYEGIFIRSDKWVPTRARNGVAAAQGLFRSHNASPVKFGVFFCCAIMAISRIYA